MISRSFPPASGLLLLAMFWSASPAPSAEATIPFPDTLILKDGTTITGLIIKNSRDAILIQEKSKESLYQKSDIIRIQDEADIAMTFTEVSPQGEFPAWRVIANDLRTHDAIQRLEEIPATPIGRGECHNVPYKSFRVNTDIELNIYGNPEDPAGLELGIFGSRSRDKELRKTLRAYLAGFLSSREEISALYDLNFNGGQCVVGDVILEISPKDAKDARGAWWISLANVKKLAKARVSDSQYLALTRPVDEVLDKKGNLITRTWDSAQESVAESLQDLSDSAGSVLRGFYRNKDGDLRLITGPEDGNGAAADPAKPQS